jgi:TRAP-type C4-dicarboxylate transport system permease small subunit
MRRLIGYFDRFNRWSIIFGCVATGILMLTAVINIIVRLFGGVIPGAYSIIVLIAVFVISPSLIAAAIEKRQISIDSLYGKYSPKGKLTVDWISGIIGIAIWGTAAWVGFQHAWDMWIRVELLDPLNIPVAPFRFVWNIFLVLFCVGIFMTLLETLVHDKKKEGVK